MNGRAPVIRPHKQFAEILAALDRAKEQAQPWTGLGYRVAALSYASPDHILSGRGSHEYGGRWNAAGTFPAVYCSLLPETAVTESMARFGKAGLPPRKPLPAVLVLLHIKLQKTLDTTVPNESPLIRAILEQAKLENWQRLQDEGQEASSQAIGRAARQLGIEGILFESAAAAGAHNLVVFPGNLKAPSFFLLDGEDILRKYLHE